ncbi:hypothetical protein L1887_32573 [Cichorium endivia]|nr:hypothetical protein L1887_32573 [Cichorium endivia]
MNDEKTIRKQKLEKHVLGFKCFYWFFHSLILSSLLIYELYFAHDLQISASSVVRLKPYWVFMNYVIQFFVPFIPTSGCASIPATTTPPTTTSSAPASSSPP